MPFALVASLGFGLTSLAGLRAEDLVIDSSSSILIDADSGAMLFGRNIHQQRPPASTTKILTAILVAEKCEPTDIVTANAEAAKVPESSMHLKAGEKLSVRQLLHGMLMRSANDACVAGAIHISGSVPKFVNLMNQRAKELGCTETHFHNPNGLPDPVHVTSAHDLAILGRQAMRYPLIREIVGKQKATLERSINFSDREVENRNKLLALDPTINGIKTGWTRAAGHCFVGSVSRGERNLISVVLNSQNWEKDTMHLMDWGTANSTVKDLVVQGEVTEEKDMDGGSTKLVAIASNGAKRLVTSETILTRTVSWLPDLKLPISAGQSVGKVTFRDQNGWTIEVPLVARDAVVKQEKTAVYYGGSLILGLGLLGAYSAIRHRRQSTYGRIAFPNS